MKWSSLPAPLPPCFKTESLGSGHGAADNTGEASPALHAWVAVFRGAACGVRPAGLAVLRAADQFERLSVKCKRSWKPAEECKLEQGLRRTGATYKPLLHETGCIQPLHKRVILCQCTRIARNGTSELFLWRKARAHRCPCLRMHTRVGVVLTFGDESKPLSSRANSK